MKKKIAALIAAVLMLTCACALADDVVTAESLLAGNGLRPVWSAATTCANTRSITTRTARCTTITT